MSKTTAIVAPVLAAVLCTTGLFAAPAAFAAPTASTKSIEVRYGDLDLASADGQQRLNQRIVRAAKAVCRDERATGSLITPVDHACYKQALSNTRERVAAAIDASREQLGG
jgi:UrcA family protein